jgi:hypothetical protein
MADDDDEQIRRFRSARRHGGWLGVVRLAEAQRDAREAQIVSRVESYLEQLIADTGQRNPTLTVRDVRAHLFEVPQ